MLTLEQRKRIQENFKIPVDYYHPNRHWIVSIDETSEMPTDHELRQIRSYIEFLLENSNLFSQITKDKVLAMDLPKTYDSNTLILVKIDGCWFYRRATWITGYSPDVTAISYRPCCLEEILAKIESIFPNRWQMWQEQHPDIFIPFIPFKKGWPKYFFTETDVPLIYQLQIHGDDSLDQAKIIKAYVDSSTQYRAEGLTWRDPVTREEIPRYKVIGYREKI